VGMWEDHQKDSAGQGRMSWCQGWRVGMGRRCQLSSTDFIGLVDEVRHLSQVSVSSAELG
jgi:hypothetical protein